MKAASRSVRGAGYSISTRFFRFARLATYSRLGVDAESATSNGLRPAAEPSRYYVGIAHVDRGLARHDSVHALNRSYRQPCDHFRRVTDQVRRQDRVPFRQQAQGVVTRWRFDGEYIHRDAAGVATPSEFAH